MKKMKKKAFLPLFLVAVSAMMISSAFAKQDNGKATEVKEQRSVKTTGKKVEEMKNFEKATTEKTNAQIFKKNTEEISTSLSAVAQEKKVRSEEAGVKNEKKQPVATVQMEVSEMEITEVELVETLEGVAEETSISAVETAEAIDSVEKVGGFKKFLVGTDYKNLGQLRSSLVRNRNEIRKLTALSDATLDDATKLVIEEQLTSLMQERERIKTVITDNQGGFSLLGWVFKFLSGYPSEPVVDEAEEEALQEDVLEAITENEETTEVSEGDENVPGESAETVPVVVDPAVTDPDTTQTSDDTVATTDVEAVN